MSLPPSLKSLLVDDWDLITRQARLYELPASQPICNVLSDFLEASEAEIIKSESTCEIKDCTSSEPENSQVDTTKLPINPGVRREFVAEIQHLFNLTIGSHLLYEFERLQYAELLKHHTDKRMSDIYGSIHLLRLFVKLRDMVSYLRVDDHSLPMLEASVAEFLQSSISVRYRPSAYATTPPPSPSLFALCEKWASTEITFCLGTIVTSNREVFGSSWLSIVRLHLD
ncbi:unnamed protein product [Trichobilharzia szidati]|nr:unnamed protein product [Trichobilharzia szidati]